MDIRYALRVLYKAPGFTVSVVVVLALGIGSNAAIFSAIDQIVIRPLPYADPDRLAMVWEDFSAITGAAKNRVSPGTFRDWQRRSRAFEVLGAYGLRSRDLAGGGPPEQILGLGVTASLIPMLGIRPLLGRTFTSDEEGPETRAVVLSYRLWQQRFGGDRNIVGSAITTDGQAYTVIG